MCYKKLLVVEFLKTSDHYKLKTADHLEGFYEIRCKKKLVVWILKSNNFWNIGFIKPRLASVGFPIKIPTRLLKSYTVVP